MKNIHILPTDKPSRLLRNGKELLLVDIPKNYTFFGNTVSVNIYITSDELPKLDEWGINNRNGVVFKCKGFTPDTEDKKYDRKIILTTDEYLVRNGVQAIPDDVIKWFVKNPSCNYVDLIKLRKEKGYEFLGYEIIIPREEPKQVFTKGDKVLYTGKLLNEEVVDKLVTVFYTLGRGGITDMSDIMDEYTHIYRVWNKDLKHIPKEEEQKQIKCYDKFNQLLKEGDYVDVQKDGPHLIYKKEDGQLYFKPYGKEYKVSAYFSNDMVKCDEVGNWINNDRYEDIVEEPKQKTIAEIAEKLHQKGLQDDLGLSFHDGIKFGAKWQMERMYSEEEVIDILLLSYSSISDKSLAGADLRKWFEQFKKK